MGEGAGSAAVVTSVGMEARNCEVACPMVVVAASLMLGTIGATGVKDVPTRAAIMTCYRVMAYGASSSSDTVAEVSWLSPVSSVDANVEASCMLPTSIAGAGGSYSILLSEMAITSASLLSASDSKRRSVVSMLQSEVKPSMMQSFGLWSTKQLSQTIATKCEAGACWWFAARSPQCPARGAKALASCARVVGAVSMPSESELGGEVIMQLDRSDQVSAA